jgi:putative heme transporter
VPDRDAPPSAGVDSPGPPTNAAAPDEMIEPFETEPPAAPRSMRKKVLQGLLSFGLVGLVFVFVLPQIADLSEVWKQIQDMTGLEIAVLVVVAIWNLATYWILIVIATPGLTYPQAVVVAESTTAVANTVPAGGAVSLGLTYAMLGSWGFSKSRVTLSVLVTGIWNNFAKLAMPIVAVSLLALEGGAGGGRIVSALIGFGALIAAVAVFALILRSEHFAARIGNGTARWVTKARGLFRKGPVTGYDLAVLKFRSRVIGLVHKRWLPLTFWTIVSHFSLYAVLLTSLRQIGVSDDEVSWTQVLAVFAFARLLTAIPLTPGGLGVIELALIGGLDAAGGGHVQVVGAVLLFRLLTYVVPIPLGLVTYVFWRRNTSWRDSAPPLPAEFAASTP